MKKKKLPSHLNVFVTKVSNWSLSQGYIWQQNEYMFMLTLVNPFILGF